MLGALAARLDGGAAAGFYALDGPQMGAGRVLDGVGHDRAAHVVGCQVVEELLQLGRVGAQPREGGGRSAARAAASGGHMSTLSGAVRSCEFFLILKQ